VTGRELGILEQPLGDRRQIDCVEIYVPKSIRFLAELYQFLREKVTNRLGWVVLDGFSIYEVDGAFRGARLWEERTLIIRLLFIRGADTSVLAVEAKIKEIGSEMATRIVVGEEQMWVCHYPQTLTVFRGLRKLATQE